MSQLSAQSIKRLCQPYKWWSFGFIKQTPMIYPFLDKKVVINGMSAGLSAAFYDCRIAHDLVIEPGEVALAYTIEKFCIPNNVCGYVCDKSSYARRFISALNTLFDSGFEGDAVLELVNLGKNSIELKAGDPICQFAFHWLDKPTDRAYKGKYTGQKGAQSTIYEK